MAENHDTTSETTEHAAQLSARAITPDTLETIQRAIAEDVGDGDVTTNSTVPADARARVQIIAKQDGVVAGLEVARAVFLQFDDQIVFTPHVSDGATVAKGQILADVSGSVRGILTGERTALNFLGRMSGIATLTHEFVTAVQGTRAVILDTRKTAPGLRATDKLAVKLGGGQNHRIGLFDMVMIKDNHIDFAGSLAEAVRRVRAGGTELEIEVEARSIEEVREALAMKVERVLLDNMTPEMMREAVKLNGGFAKLEASGNVNLETVRKIAETGVDYISVGALTHSPCTFDVSLKWIKN
ncbi:MAG TPA: carboxylating nicotinate-nucleotide diphosphorylase [Pyrinomonadaceae bacterium]|nr:carboxylating nicotinate-nucleotide diphosphorylase [Pyrinomonadaceae bacterium]